MASTTNLRIIDFAPLGRELSNALGGVSVDTPSLCFLPLLNLSLPYYSDAYYFKQLLLKAKEQAESFLEVSKDEPEGAIFYEKDGRMNGSYKAFCTMFLNKVFPKFSKWFSICDEFVEKVEREKMPISQFCSSVLVNELNLTSSICVEYRIGLFNRLFSSKASKDAMRAYRIVCCAIYENSLSSYLNLQLLNSCISFLVNFEGVNFFDPVYKGDTDSFLSDSTWKMINMLERTLPDKYMRRR